MQTLERRHNVRFTLLKPSAKLIHNGVSYDVNIIDIGREGVGISGDIGPKSGVTDSNRLISIPIKNDVITRQLIEAKEGSYPEHNHGFIFKEPLTDQELFSLLTIARGPNEKEFDQAVRDREECLKQLRLIQNCRSNIFMGTLAAIGAVAMTTGVILSPLISVPGNIISVYLKWVLFGSTVAGVLLTVGILSTIEKARAINIRKSFLNALNKYLTQGHAPLKFSSWGDMQHSQSGCGIRRRLENCPLIRKFKRDSREYEIRKDRGDNPSATPPVPPETCWTIGNEEARRTSREQKLIPGMFDSFMSLSGNIYMGIYCLVCCIGLFVVSKEIAIEYILNWHAVAGLAMGGIILGAIVLILQRKLINIRQKRKRKKINEIDKTEPERVLARWIILVGGALLLLFICAFLAEYPLKWFKKQENILQFFGGISIVSIAAYLSWLACYMVFQLSKVRRGLYSIHSLTASWGHAFLDCYYNPPIKDRLEIENMLHR